IRADQSSAKTDLETDIIQHPLDFISGVGDAANAGEIRQVLSCRPGRLTLAGLVADEADKMSDGERIRHDVVSPQSRAPLARWKKGGQNPDSRRLSRTVQSEKAVERPLRDSERDVIDRDELAKSASEALGLDGVIREPVHRVRRQRTNAAQKQIMGRIAD